ncbi:hypothetical protein like AT1G30320 [Hibiscus trionum]|uniref:Remorin C-terminal domain-containing protein n=1 Tax=Hibiscus trionum TaxID=183268 RepID=A0A9W7I1U1_HIBTR|nr:hypothetical protein like AT1G30320 [Hibiscus trionum]
MEPLPRENIDAGHAKLLQFSKTDNGNSSAIHPVRSFEDENLDYDSNASSSSFEFHKGDRVVHSSMTRLYSRPMSSKWNDAEKWLMNGQNMQASYAKKSKHTARFRYDSILYELYARKAEMRRIEAKVEQMRAQAEAKMVKKIAMAKQRSEEKRAAAESRKHREAERTYAQAEYIRRTGRMPSSRYICCGWLS